MTKATDTSDHIEAAGVDRIRSGGEALFRQHWQDAMDRPGRVSPNWMVYYELEERKRLISLAATTSTGEIIGYSASDVAADLHESERIVATNLAVFVDRAHRGSRIGSMLLTETEHRAVKRGAELIRFHAGSGSRFERWLLRHGYREIARLYEKDI